MQYEAKYLGTFLTTPSSQTKFYDEFMTIVIFNWWTSLDLYESPVARVPNQQQTACEPCPGNLVSNYTFVPPKCGCPGDLVFNDQKDKCEHLLSNHNLSKPSNSTVWNNETIEEFLEELLLVTS